MCKQVINLLRKMVTNYNRSALMRKKVINFLKIGDR